MKQLFLVLLLIPTLCIAQKKSKGYSSVSIGPEIPLKQGQDIAFGAHFSGNASMGKGAYLGVGIGILKFSDLDGVYLPLSARLTTLFNKNPDNTSLMFVLEPGYGAYNRTKYISNTYIQTKGGFTFFSGLGVAFKSDKKSRGFFMVGYSNYSFETLKIKTMYEAIGFRAGIMLK